ncbi:MAG TPA: hypothetical protein VGQ35_20725 [Dongiaceae bacterium]|nr:hypothetical protein [Dongiaceae bacterium]
MFLQTIAEEDATGKIAEIYGKEKAPLGFVPEAARCLTTRPTSCRCSTNSSTACAGDFRSVAGNGASSP